MQEYLVIAHIVILIVTLVIVLWADHLGLEWLRGKTATIDSAVLAKLHVYVWIGLGAMMVTGAILAYPLRDYLLSNPRFYVKMWYVGMLVINGLAIGVVSQIATKTTYREVPKKQKAKLLAVGVISTLAWTGAIIGGLSLGL
jgi:hypothetical protein